MGVGLCLQTLLTAVENALRNRLRADDPTTPEAWGVRFAIVDLYSISGGTIWVMRIAERDILLLILIVQCSF